MKIQSKAEFDKINDFGIGASNDMFAKYFIGNSFLNPLVEIGKAPIFLANVSFEPACCNNWHIHHADKGAVRF